MTKPYSTIDDVAKAAGVARVTVSRVLNNEQNVSAETRQKVQRAVEALDYSVNKQAGHLRAAPDGPSCSFIRTIPIASPIVTITRVSSSVRFALALTSALICHARHRSRPRRSGRLLASIVERERPAGIVLPPPLSDDVELLRRMKRGGVRTVAVSAGEQGRRVVPSSGIDERAGGRRSATISCRWDIAVSGS